MYKLLRRKCSNCHHFRLNQQQVNRYRLRLKLIDAGMYVEALQLGNLPSIHMADESVLHAPKSDATHNAGSEDPVMRVTTWYNEQPGDAELMRQMETEADRRLSARHGLPVPMTQSMMKLRHDIIRQFFDDTVSQRCQNCGAVSPSYSHDGALKIFRQPLAASSLQRNSGLGVVALPSPFTDLARMQKQTSAADAATAQIAEQMVVNEADQRAAVDDSCESSDSGDEDSVSATTAETDTTHETQPTSDFTTTKSEPTSLGQEAITVMARTQGNENRLQYISAAEASAHMQLLWMMEAPFVSLAFGEVAQLSHQNGHATFARVSDGDAIFFIRLLYVPPIRCRPNDMMDGKEFESPHTAQLRSVLELNVRLKELTLAARPDALRRAYGIDPGKVLTVGAGSSRMPMSLAERHVAEIEAMSEDIRLSEILQALIQLQQKCNGILDSTKSGQRDARPGVRQLLEHKEGLFRMNMMGKRVNFAARSVISPDPSLRTSEIGVPEVFARELTFPEPVSEATRDRLAQLVRNGASSWPGANFVEGANGRLWDLSRLSATERDELANTQIHPPLPGARSIVVYRHLTDGDLMLVNRQPTLHKPSIMAHEARVLRNQRTIRFHYSNCSVYNADFDGDEINIHLPQSLNARAESRFITLNERQYITPTAGEPERGLIQDHVIAGITLTNRNTFLTREQYLQFVNVGIQGIEGSAPESRAITLCPPAILFPRPLWTGKQVVTTLVRYVTAGSPPPSFIAKCKTPAKLWGADRFEQVMYVRQGEVLTGLVDKAHLGASRFGLVHAIQDLYGAVAAGHLLSALTRVCMEEIRSHGHTCSIEDLLLTPESEAERTRLGATVDDGVPAIISRLTGLDSAELTDAQRADPHVLALALKQSLDKNPDLAAAVDAALIGHVNPVTSAVISAVLPQGLLRPFPDNGLALMILTGAKGSMVNLSQITCCLGQQVLEGRRVPLMCSGRSLPSFRPYDVSPRAGGLIQDRFMTGLRPQEYFFHAMSGREGLIDTAVKTANSGYLQRCIIKQLESVHVAYDSTVRDSDNSVIQFLYGEDGIDVLKRSYLQRFDFSAMNVAPYIARLKPKDALGHLTEKPARRAWKVHHACKAEGRPLPDPVTSQLSPTRDLGCVSDAFEEGLTAFLDANKEGLVRTKDVKKAAERLKGDSPVASDLVAVRKATDISSSSFRALMHLRYLRCLAEPGEAVGVMAGQSIGQPATQMTLNTFHLAGHGAVNVTLGIPRLREILMTAATEISSPVMRLVLNPGTPREDADHLAALLQRVTFADCLQMIRVRESLVDSEAANGASSTRSYCVEFLFRPITSIQREYHIGATELRRALLAQLAPALARAVLAERRRRGDMKLSVSSRIVDNKDDGDIDRILESERRHEGGDLDGVSMDGSGEHITQWSRSMVGIERISYQMLPSPCHGASFHIETAPADGILTEPVDVDGEVINGVCVGSITLHVPSTDRKLLLVSITEQVVEKVVVKAIPGIKRALVSEENGVFSVATEGTNLLVGCGFDRTGLAMLPRIPQVDSSHIYTNDIALILNKYGVEAANAAIVREIASVFGVYGISVDRRHLSLIADFMTQAGGFRPYNRMGMADLSSIFQKASFEASTSNIRRSALDGDNDSLSGASSRISLGMPCCTGTGSEFRLFQDLSVEAGIPFSK